VVLTSILKRDFFNDLAESWDEEEREQTLLDTPFQLIPVQRGMTVLDVGSGTGALIPLILPRIGPQGVLYELDFAEKMIARAKEKFPPELYPQIHFVVEDLLNFLPLFPFDLVLCYSTFPHFEEKQLALKKMASMLEEGGLLVIFHTSGRKEINAFHRRAHPVVARDLLPEAETIGR